MTAMGLPTIDLLGMPIAHVDRDGPFDHVVLAELAARREVRCRPDFDLEPG